MRQIICVNNMMTDTNRSNKIKCKMNRNDRNDIFLFYFVRQKFRFVND